MNIYEAATSRRAVRAFTDQPVPHETLERVLEHTRSDVPRHRPRLGRPEWADLGVYLQTVMLLLRAEGLHSCPQMAWAQVRKTVAEIVAPPDQLILFCGMSIGFEDTSVSHPRTDRARLDEVVTFLGL